MLKNQRIVILFPIIICLIFSSCRNKEKRIHFSFEKAQEIYYQELVKYESTRFNPFYIDKAFFQKTEQQLNEEIEQSCYCSVLIRSSINNGILEIAAIYDSENEIWFHLFKHDGSQKRIKLQDLEIKEILKSKPRKSIIINESNLSVYDGLSEYVIKKIDNKTYFYANHHGEIDDDYKPLMNLFRSFFISEF
ncbi:MAG: hypothetical protein J6Y69_03315 [Treponema sp.]|nr:hypothetical protein [Treponema sp.]